MDFHPTEPWILASLYDGHAYIWNYETQVWIGIAIEAVVHDPCSTVPTMESLTTRSVCCV